MTPNTRPLAYPPGQADRALAPGRTGQAAVLGALAALVLFRGILSYPGADSSNRAGDTGLDSGWAIVADRPPQGAAVLATLSESLALDFLTRIWGSRPDLRVVTAPEAQAILAPEMPLLAVTQAALPLVPAEISPGAHYTALGRTLVGVTGAPNARPLWDPTAGQELAWRHDYGTELRLNGGRVVRNEATGETVLLLGWEALQPTKDWSVSVRLLEGEDEIAQVDREHPVMGAYPTSRWAPGEVVGDAYVFPAELAARADAAKIILYRQGSGGSFENLDEAVKPLP